MIINAFVSNGVLYIKLRLSFVYDEMIGHTWAANTKRGYGDGYHALFKDFDGQPVTWNALLGEK